MDERGEIEGVKREGNHELWILRKIKAEVEEVMGREGKGEREGEWKIARYCFSSALPLKKR